MQDQWVLLGISVHSCHVLTNPLADLLKTRCYGEAGLLLGAYFEKLPFRND